MSLSQLPHLVSLSFCWPLHNGNQLLVGSGDLLLLDNDLFLPLHDLDFKLLQADLLLLLRCLQLIRQLSFSFLGRVKKARGSLGFRVKTSACRVRFQSAYLGVDLLIKCSLLQLQLSLGIGHLGVRLELDVHHFLPTFCFLVED